jgi:DNA polymerase-3 subunit delta
VILAFTGDRFLARRAARRALRERGLGPGDVTELGEGLEPEAIGQAARQSGLFGATGLLLDFDAAFQGQAGVAARNAAIKVLEEIPSDALVVVIDAKATEARKKRWRALGELDDRPTPRYGALRGWVAQELKERRVRATRGVPALLADLFGEDLPGLASEIEKLAVLDEELDEDRVRTLVNRPASRDAFDMIDAIVAGDPGTAIATARLLLDAGEAAPRVLGALAWQFALIARAVALRERDGDVAKGVAAKALGVAPYPAGKAMEIARRVDEATLLEVFEVLLDAETAAKTGRRDPAWAVEAAALTLADRFGDLRAA